MGSSREWGPLEKDCGPYRNYLSEFPETVGQLRPCYRAVGSGPPLAKDEVLQPPHIRLHVAGDNLSAEVNPDRAESTRYTITPYDPDTSC